MSGDEAVPAPSVSSNRIVLFTLPYLPLRLPLVHAVAVPSFIVWLLGFYALFHCWLNILAELLRFADRTFFSDWWNATTIEAFWRKWNKPVHEWCLRHVFVDLQQLTGVPRHVSMLAVFLFSAVFHELLFSVAFKTFRPWFFLGMLGQVPLIAGSKAFEGTRRGNYIVWLALFLGQPFLELLYFREWFQTNQSFFCAPSPVELAQG